MEIDKEIYRLIGTHGIISVHNAIEKYMKEEYKYVKKVLKKDNILRENVEIEALKEEKKEKVYRDPKEMKQWQKEQEEKKRKENEIKGINSKDLLTKENLKKWLEEEGLTYSYIAREYVGCKDIEVSAIAKLLGIKKLDKIE